MGSQWISMKRVFFNIHDVRNRECVHLSPLLEHNFTIFKANFSVEISINVTPQNEPQNSYRQNQPSKMTITQK